MLWSRQSQPRFTWAARTWLPLLEFLKKDNPHDPIVYAVAFVFYFVCSFIVIFFNAALVFCAMQAFAGRPPSLRAGLATAAGRLPQILGWTVVAATVGVLLNLSPDHLTKRAALIAAVKIDDVRRLARRLLRDEALVTVVVGKPVGVTSDP